jgi:hypothetical protein
VRAVSIGDERRETSGVSARPTRGYRGRFAAWLADLLQLQAMEREVLTLTAPHFRNRSIGECIWIVLDAWALFLKRLNRHLADRDALSAEFFRVFEWTIGDDGRGHPHLHVWLLCPYLERDELQRWWGEALASLTGDAASLRAVIHIAEVSGHDVDQELIKYLTKDITPDGAKLAPELYAEVYKALDERRSTQASKGFMARADEARRVCECGCTLPKRVRHVRANDEGPAT